MMRTFRLRLAVLVLPMMLLPCSSNAQGRSHGYVSLGAGATDTDWGVDWLIPTTPIGIGAEMGVGNLLVLSFSGSYHPLAHRAPRKLDPFATVGFMTMTDLNYDAVGVNVGGGVTYWPRKRVGLRLDCFSFLATHDNIRLEDRHHWGVRAGVAFHFW